jgi:hypothetical protein
MGPQCRTGSRDIVSIKEKCPQYSHLHLCACKAFTAGVKKQSVSKILASMSHDVSAASFGAFCLEIIKKD